MLPRFAESCDAPELQAGAEAHLEQTKAQADRLKRLFTTAGEKPTGRTSMAMAALIKEADEILKDRDKTDPLVLDAALIAAMQSVEHYEIASYGCARAYAKVLKDKEAENILAEILLEEETQDRLLSVVADKIVNPDAATAYEV